MGAKTHAFRYAQHTLAHIHAPLNTLYLSSCSARALSDEARSAVAGWFSVYRGHEEGRARVALASGEHVHPALERALGVLDKAWAEVRRKESKPWCTL